ncbi:MAG: TIGR01458 family HAD-type hydrolase [Pseudomonadales bacterium]
MPNLLIDLDGVLYEGDRAVAGAAGAIRWIEGAQIPHLFVTNTTSKPRQAIVDKLAGFGIDVDTEQILTPAVAAVRYLSDRGHHTVALFVAEATRAEFQHFRCLGPEETSGAEAVVVGDMGEAWDFATLNRAFRLLMADPAPELIALGMTRYWKAPDGLRLDTAPFVVALAHASGVEPVVVGKPAAAFFEAALDLLEARAEDTFMIGDDIRSDVDGAQSLGIRGLLVRTGKFRRADLEGDIEPTAVLDSIDDLQEWWQRH